MVGNLCREAVRLGSARLKRTFGSFGSKAAMKIVIMSKIRSEIQYYYNK